MATQDDQPNGPKGFRKVWAGLTGAFSRNVGDASEGPVGGSTGTDPLIGYHRQARSYEGQPDTQSRDQKSLAKLKLFNGEVAELVDAWLRIAFHPKNYKRLRFSIHTSTNELRRVVRKVSILYKEPAKRRLLERDVTQTQDAGATAPGKQTVQGKVTKREVGAAAKAAEDLDAIQGEAGGTGVELATGDAEVDALAEVLELEDAQVDDEDTPFARLQRAADLDTILDSVERLASCQPCVWLRPNVVYDDESDTDTGRITFICYVPGQAGIIPHKDDPTQAVAWWYWADEMDAQGKVRRVRWFWTAENIEKLNEKWEVLRIEPNLLGRLPVTAFRIDTPLNGYYCDGVGDDLLDGTIEICALKTIQNSRGKDAGFKQLVFSGAHPDKVPSDQVMGGPTPVYLGDGGQVNVVDLQPNLDAFTVLARERERSLDSTYGVREPESSAAGVQSGYAKKLDQAELLEESKRRRKHFAKAEQDLYNLLAVLLDKRPIPRIGKLDPSAELVVDFAEPRFDENPAEQAQVDARELKMNKVSIVDVLKRANPDLSDVDLVRLAYRNKRINDALMTQDQKRLVDILSSGAIVGGSIDKGGGPPGAGAPPEGGEDEAA